MKPIYLAGPTAVGKSAVALELAERIGGEIISVDSMQVYRGMDIGTAKPSPGEQKRVRHHLIDVVDLTETFDAAQFLRLARAAEADIKSRGKTPIFCGGTGFYFKALLEGLGDSPPGDPKLRAELQATPMDQLLSELQQKDPEFFQKVDQKNPRRVIRALEVIRLTGKPNSAQRAVWSSTTTGIGFHRSPKNLHERIHQRVDEMFRLGLVAETEQLLTKGLAENETAMQALGYRQVVEHLKGQRSLPETIELVKIRTRQFAKRQLTWFRRQMRLDWISLDVENPSAIVKKIAATLLLLIGFNALGSTMTINADKVFVLDGKKIFPIGFTMPPPVNGITPDRTNAFQELKSAGANFLRTGAWDEKWSRQVIAKEQSYEDAAARHGLHCLVFLRELTEVKSTTGGKKTETMLREVVNQFKNHPGFGAWKGADEPEWGKIPVERLLRGSSIVRELDPHHPIILIQAPRGTIQSLQSYNPTADAVGADIYPVSVPPGIHDLIRTNTQISLVGDYTRNMMAVADGKQPVWMVLQIAWSGTTKPGKKLVMPTLAEERFMTYEAIINGARGLLYFGGNITKAMSPSDARLGWNWTFWNQVLRPVISEIGEKSPLYPALLEANSSLPIKCSASDIEYCVREVGSEIYILACKRGRGTEQVSFTGLPPSVAGGEVLFESRPVLEIQQGQFSDNFGPFGVHVYHCRQK